MALTTHNTDWESSFNQILNRTKQNLNRINQKYAPPGAAGLSSVGGHAGESILYSRGAGGGLPNNENTPNQGSLLNDRYATTFANKSASANADKDTALSLNERLSRIESLQDQQSHVEQLTSARLQAIEKSLSNIQHSVDKSTTEFQGLERSMFQLQNRLTTVNGLLEVVQNDAESKKAVVSKMDSWIRQGEQWREEIDDKMDAISKQTRVLDRSRQDQQSMQQEYATKFDLDVLRDKLNVTTQQSVAASLSAWHDKMEQSVRNVEQQVALLRIGRTAAPAVAGSSGEDTQQLSQDEVAAALQTPLPSELLLKGTVASEVLEMEQKLEDKLEGRLQSFMKNELSDAQQSLQQLLNHQLHDICRDMGLEYNPVFGTGGSSGISSGGGHNADNLLSGAAVPSRGGVGGGELYSSQTSSVAPTSNPSDTYRVRLLEARRKSEEEMTEMQRSIEQLKTELQSLNGQTAVERRHMTGQLSHLEHKIEEAVAMSTGGVNAIKERSGRLEDVVRESELALRNLQNKAKEDLVERLNDLSRDWATERAGLDRRLLVNEKIAEDCLDRIKLSQTAIETYFQNNADVRRFQRNVEATEKMQQMLTGIQQEVRDTSATLLKLQANATTKNDHLELRERVARLEPTVLEKLPDYFASTKKAMDLSLVLQGKIENLDTLTGHHRNELSTCTSKLSMLELSNTQLKGLTGMQADECKRVAQALTEIDANSRKDINYLRELTNSLSSQVRDANTKITLATQSYSSESTAMRRDVEKLSTQCDKLQGESISTQQSLQQLQWIVESLKSDTVSNSAKIQQQMQFAPPQPVSVPVSTPVFTAEPASTAAAAATEAPPPTTAANSSSLPAEPPLDQSNRSYPTNQTNQTKDTSKTEDTSRNSSDMSSSDASSTSSPYLAASAISAPSRAAAAAPTTPVAQQSSFDSSSTADSDEVVAATTTAATTTAATVGGTAAFLTAPSSASAEETGSIQGSASSPSQDSTSTPLSVQEDSSPVRGAGTNSTTMPAAVADIAAGDNSIEASLAVENSWDASMSILPEGDEAQQQQLLHQQQQQAMHSMSQIPQQSAYDISIESMDKSGQSGGGNNESTPKMAPDTPSDAPGYVSVIDSSGGAADTPASTAAAAAAVPTNDGSDMDSATAADDFVGDGVDNASDGGGSYSLSDSAGSISNLDKTIQDLQQHRENVLKSPPSTKAANKTSSFSSGSASDSQQQLQNLQQETTSSSSGGGSGALAQESVEASEMQDLVDAFDDDNIDDDNDANAAAARDPRQFRGSFDKLRSPHPSQDDEGAVPEYGAVFDAQKSTFSHENPSDKIPGFEKQESAAPDFGSVFDTQKSMFSGDPTSEKIPTFEKQESAAPDFGSVFDTQKSIFSGDPTSEKIPTFEKQESAAPDMGGMFETQKSAFAGDNPSDKISYSGTGQSALAGSKDPQLQKEMMEDWDEDEEDNEDEDEGENKNVNNNNNNNNNNNAPEGAPAETLPKLAVTAAAYATAAPSAAPIAADIDTSTSSSSEAASRSTASNTSSSDSSFLKAPTAGDVSSSSISKPPTPVTTTAVAAATPAATATSTHTAKNLSIKERLRQRQEALRQQKLSASMSTDSYNSEAQHRGLEVSVAGSEPASATQSPAPPPSSSSSSSSSEPAPTTTKTTATAGGGGSTRGSTSSRSGGGEDDAVMSFSELEESTDG